MKKLKGLIVLIYILVTVVVLMIQPVIHKPAVLENTDFKIKDQLLYPKEKRISDYEVKLKFTRATPIAQKTKNSEIHIKPGDNRRLSVDFQTGESIKNTIVKLEENTSTINTEMVIDPSGVNDKFTNQNFKIDEQDMNYSDKTLNVDDLEINSRDLEIGDKMKASREEVIAWNIWRSNLQNNIMDRSAVEAPVGTTILFSFMVTESGKIYDVKFSCSNKKYEEEAKNDFISVLQMIEGTDILKFPKNTKRTRVRFRGGFLLDYSTQYSSPSDYSDYERVKL